MFSRSENGGGSPVRAVWAFGCIDSGKRIYCIVLPAQTVQPPPFGTLRASHPLLFKEGSFVLPRQQVPVARINTLAINGSEVMVDLRHGAAEAVFRLL